jgi:hypothetical protein
MQILVTNTVLSLATLVLKTAVSWALLRASRKHQRRQQAKKLASRKEVLTAEAAAAVVRRTCLSPSVMASVKAPSRL